MNFKINIPLCFLLVFISCAGENVQTNTNLERMHILGRDLQSEEWVIRYKAVKDLKSYGNMANDYALYALQDKSDVVSRLAQVHFVAQGENALSYLTDKIETTELDTGMYASIAGGEERNRRKSLAMTLWLVLVRGMDWDRGFELLANLARHPSDKVRCVALFTAVSSRTPRFMTFIEKLRNDESPRVRRAFQDGLIRLLCKPNFLDENTTGQVLQLIKPELISIFNRDEHGFTMSTARLPELLGWNRLMYRRQEFAQMICEIIPDPKLSIQGAVYAGNVLKAQSRSQELSAQVSSWIPVLHLTSSENMSKTNRHETTARILSAISAFPMDAISSEHSETLIKKTDELIPDHPHQVFRGPFLMSLLYRKSLKNGSAPSNQDALNLLLRCVAHSNDEMALAAANACCEILNVLVDNKHEIAEKRIQEALKSQADRIYRLAQDASLRQLSDHLNILVHVKDSRVKEVFDLIWSHRFSKTWGDEKYIIPCIYVMENYDADSILPYMLYYVTSGHDVPSTSLKDVCMYRLAGKANIAAFLTDEIFERWIEVVQDKEEHPRFRSAFASLLLNPELPDEKRMKLEDALLPYSFDPHDRNLRSKIIWGLGVSGDHRVLAPLYLHIMDPDSPMWCWYNTFYGLAGIHGVRLEVDGPAEGSIDSKKKAAEAIIDVIEDMEVSLDWRKPAPEQEPEVIHLNNYYGFTLQYKFYAPIRGYTTLEQITEQKLGQNFKQWKKWINQWQIQK